MVSNSLSLESWKARGLRLELETLTNFKSFFYFLGPKSAIFSYYLPHIIVSKHIKKNTCVPIRMVGINAISDHE